MKYITLTLLLFISFNVNANDFSKGVDAYKNSNYQEAFKWFEKSAVTGNSKAQYYLALMYSEGEGVLKDEKESVKWFKKSAEQGNAKAQFNLGFMYDSGKGILKNKKSAFKWYKESAHHGFAKAQNNLAVMYCLGDGVLKNLNKCSYWAQMAEENGEDVNELMRDYELWKYIE